MGEARVRVRGPMINLCRFLHRVHVYAYAWRMASLAAHYGLLLEAFSPVPSCRSGHGCPSWLSRSTYISKAVASSTERLLLEAETTREADYSLFCSFQSFMAARIGAPAQHAGKLCRHG